MMQRLGAPRAWLNDWWHLAIVGWATALLAGISLIGIANAYHDPTLQTGAIFGAGVVGHFALGVNAWFLKSLRDDLSLKELNQMRLASPYVVPRLLGSNGDRLSVHNYGSGVAGRVAVIVFQTIHGALKRDAGVLTVAIPGESEVMGLEVQEGLVAPEKPPVDLQPPHRVCVVNCWDEIGRQHSRWYVIFDRDEYGQYAEELAAGMAAVPGALAAPEGMSEPVRYVTGVDGFDQGISWRIAGVQN